jgi:hypothetical protein
VRSLLNDVMTRHQSKDRSFIDPIPATPLGKLPNRIIRSGRLTATIQLKAGLF